tara:strand:+ start:6986 stop:7339 length:354 start_codon:yes stop_codon:yes gene_type:complete
MSGSEPDAPAPEVMHFELGNMLFAASGGKMSRDKCNEVVTRMLARQMEYYAAMATPEVTASSEEQMMAVGELQGLVNALITTGANYTQFMSAQQLTHWHQITARARGSMQRVLEMFT